jgi:hypothetical protein
LEENYSKISINEEKSITKEQKSAAIIIKEMRDLRNKLVFVETKEPKKLSSNIVAQMSKGVFHIYETEGSSKKYFFKKKY